MGGYVPKVATLDGFREITEKIEGISLAEAGSGETLIVQTKESTYTIFITDSTKREVVVTGGKYFPSHEKCILSGSSFGGSFLKVGWIGIGMHVEFHRSNNRRVITSPVVTISFSETSNHQIH